VIRNTALVIEVHGKLLPSLDALLVAQALA